MSDRRTRAAAFVLAAFAAASAPPVHAAGDSRAASRADCEREFQPEYAQSGKDVIWIPTRDALVAKMLRMAATKSTDVVVDLGSGDGKIPIAAARDFGATARGVEFDPRMVRLARCYAKAEGVSDRVTFVEGDIFATDFADATVVTLYLLPSLNMRLRPKLLALRPGTRIVSHDYGLEDWEPDEQDVTLSGRALYWMVPARVHGRWTFGEDGGAAKFDANLEQSFQHLGGTVRVGGDERRLARTRIRGDAIELRFRGERDVARELQGIAAADRIELTERDGRRTRRWIGTRAAE